MKRIIGVLTPILLLTGGIDRNPAQRQKEVRASLPSGFSVLVEHSQPHRRGPVTFDRVQHSIELVGDCTNCVNPLHVDHLVLENQYLRIEVAPQLGGRVRSVVYKPALISSNGVSKTNTQMFALDTPRGIPHDKLQVGVPWNYGGWRVSFPFYEHSLRGHDRAVSYRRRILADGTAVLTMTMYSDRFSNQPNPLIPEENYIELASHGRYSPLTLVQEIRLAPGQAFFQERLTLFNPLPYRYGFKLWDTTQLPRAKDAKFIFPVSRMAFHWGKNQAFRDWPLMNDGINDTVVDRSIFANWTAHPNKFGKSYFGLNQVYPFAAVYYPRENLNRLRITQPTIAPGLKLYSFNANEGWLDSFELWGGSAEIFEGRGHFLDPFETYSYEVKWWMPQGIGELSAASAGIAAGLVYEDEGQQTYARVRLTASHNYSDLVVSVANDTESGRVRIDRLNPETVVLFSIPVADRGSPVWVKVHEDKRELFNYQMPVKIPPADKAEEACREEIDFAVPQDKDTCSVAARTQSTGYRRAEYSELRGEYYWPPDGSDRACNPERTLNTFGRLEAQKIATAPEATARDRLIYGRILYRLGGISNFNMARQHLTAATIAEPSLGDAWLLLGTLEMEMGNVSAAATAWKNALDAAKPAPLANYFLALSAIGEGNLDAALEFVDALLAAQSDHYFARLLKAGILDRLQRHREALELLEELENVHASDPALVYLKQRVYTHLGESTKAEAMKQVSSRLEDPLRGDPSAAKRRQEFVNRLSTGTWELPLRPPHFTCEMWLTYKTLIRLQRDDWTNGLTPLN
ncbi:MAG: DUF5107 domain-containing protein [Spirulina sp.]